MNSETGATIWKCGRCGIGINVLIYVSGIPVCAWCAKEATPTKGSE